MQRVYKAGTLSVKLRFWKISPVTRIPRLGTSTSLVETGDIAKHPLGFEDAEHCSFMKEGLPHIPDPAETK